MELNYNYKSGMWNNNDNNPLLQILQHSIDESIMFSGSNNNKYDLKSSINKHKNSNDTNYDDDVRLERHWHNYIYT